MANLPDKLSTVLLHLDALRHRRALYHWVFAVCGLVLMVSPLALWVAWTPFAFKAVLAVAIIALVVLLFAVQISPYDRL